MSTVEELYSIAIDKALHLQQPFKFYDRQYKILTQSNNPTPIKYYNDILDMYLRYKFYKVKDEPAKKKALVYGLEQLVLDIYKERKNE